MFLIFIISFFTNTYFGIGTTTESSQNHRTQMFTPTLVTFSTTTGCSRLLTNQPEGRMSSISPSQTDLTISTERKSFLALQTMIFHTRNSKSSLCGTSKHQGNSPCITGLTGMGFTNTWPKSPKRSRTMKHQSTQRASGKPLRKAYSWASKHSFPTRQPNRENPALG